MAGSRRSLEAEEDRNRLATKEVGRSGQEVDHNGREGDRIDQVEDRIGRGEDPIGQEEVHIDHHRLRNEGQGEGDHIVRSHRIVHRVGVPIRRRVGHEGDHGIGRPGECFRGTLLVWGSGDAWWPRSRLESFVRAVPVIAIVEQ